jgi:non-ribosomal peptide synthase protein (TIGR01720 family)
LGIERIGVEDNFFAAGGDSILSIQVVSQARARGLQLTVRELFKYPTIGALARLIDRAQAHESLEMQQASVGEMPLMPIHRRLFENGAPRPQHYHQSQLLTVPEGFSLEFLRGFVAALYCRHDALRLRYRREGGLWRGHFAPMDEDLISRTVMAEKLRGASAASRETERLKSARALKAGFDLQQGPLFKAVYYEAGCVEDSSLLLVLHHLVIDGVSWRVLLHDLNQAFEQWRRGKSIDLAPKTTSYQQWAAILVAHADSAAVREEKDFWVRQLSQAMVPLPLDHEPQAEVTQEEVERTVIALEPEETQALLTRCVEVYRAQIQELLLAGLLLAFHDWTGARRLRVNVEGHGREEGAFARTDLSETVGWFTSLYPVCLTLPDGHGDEATLLVETIKKVKEDLRRVPHHGLNYGLLRFMAQDEELALLEREHAAPVSFNYLGQFDQQLRAAARFATAPGDTGRDVDAEHPREHLLDFNGAVSGGSLRFALDYHPRHFDRRTAEQLGSRYANALRRIIQHSEAPRGAAYTPSDFPLAFGTFERV